MKCQNCKNDVNVVSSVYVQIYSEEGHEIDTAHQYWCLSCINNYDSENNVGIPKIK